MKKNRVSTMDSTFNMLCEEVDYWRERAEVAERELSDFKVRQDKINRDSINAHNEAFGGFISLLLSKDVCNSIHNPDMVDGEVEIDKNIDTITKSISVKI